MLLLVFHCNSSDQACRYGIGKYAENPKAPRYSVPASQRPKQISCPCHYPMHMKLDHPEHTASAVVAF